MQADAADTLLYFPVAQLVQAADEVDPVLGLYFPTPKLIQPAVAGISLYLPEEQNKQSPGSVVAVFRV